MPSRFLALCVLLLASSLRADEPKGPLATQLAKVTFAQYAVAPGYSEGPTWRNGEVFFCSGSLLRVDEKKAVHKYLELNPAGTVLRADGQLLVVDNKSKAVLIVSPEGKVGVIADRWEGQTLRSLNDVTVDARGNVYWTDPEGSTPKNPVGSIFRVRPDGRVDRIGTGLAFPNGLDVDPASKFLYVIESQTQKILRYALPADDALLDKSEEFYDLGGSGGDGCAFDAAGNLWVADFHRPDTKTGRIAILSPEGKLVAHLPVPAKVVSNIAFGGTNHDEIFCTTGDPPGVFHAKVGVKGFAGHPGKPMKVLRALNVVALKPHPDADKLRELSTATAAAVIRGGSAIGPNSAAKLRELIADLTHAEAANDAAKADLFVTLERAAVRRAKDKPLLAEIKRLGGTATIEVDAPVWLREIAGDEHLPVFGRINEIVLNERTDGHKEPTPKKLSDRVTDEWLKTWLGGQEQLRRLEVSGTAVTSAGLTHLKHLKNLEVLNVCLTTVTDDGFEHLAGMTKMKRMVVCSSKITGSGFKHLAGMAQLESINLHSSPASDAGLEAIGKLTNLRRLEIVHTNVTDAGLKHLAGLTNLRQLHVASHDTTEGALPFLAKLTELDQLDVYEKAASNATCAQIAKLPKLRLLMLTGGPFDDAGVKSLAGLTTLEELTLNSAKVTDASIDALAKLTRLRKLNIAGTKITADGKAKLAKLLPKTVLTP
jgi:sugar lactone lactonase YvrE/Leucine-rich repeat (LRR) protein